MQTLLLIDHWLAARNSPHCYNDIGATLLLSQINNFLGCPTPKEWVDAALANQDILLIDHGNCEKKAAGSAFQFIFRYDDKAELLGKMSRLAREELRHFEQVLGILKKRNIPIVHLTPSRYAAGLIKLGRHHEPYKLTDNLVVGAFIEARSCERFAALVPHLDGELGDFYAGLLKSEMRHFQDYLKLAYLYGVKDDVDAFIVKVRAKEMELITSQDSDFRFHSGIPSLLAG